jgi:hypothetical protein
MKKLSILLLVSLFAIFNSFAAKEVTIVRKKGRENVDRTVTYRDVTNRIVGNTQRIVCENPGAETCPQPSSVVGESGGCTNVDPNILGDINICAIDQIVISRIKNGETHGIGTSEDGAKYSFTEGEIEGNVASYVLIITVE